MRGFFVVLIAMSVLLLVGCGDKFVHKEWNQKMTVTVEIDGQTYVGSSVQKLQMNYDAKGGPYDGYAGTLWTTTKRSSEAVIIDLGEHGYLFALWEYVYPTRYVKSYPTEYPKGPPRLSKSEEKSVSMRAKAYKGYLEALARPDNRVSLVKYPEFVMFEDITDPRTIKSFRAKGDRYAPSYHNSKSFKEVYGPTARVVSVVVENTSDPLRLDRIDKIFEAGFFETWLALAHGDKNHRGPCWNASSEYSKRNKAYCRASIADFRFDSIRSKAR